MLQLIRNNAKWHSLWKQGYGFVFGVQDGDRGDIYKSKCDNGRAATATEKLT